MMSTTVPSLFLRLLYKLLHGQILDSFANYVFLISPHKIHFAVKLFTKLHYLCLQLITYLFEFNFPVIENPKIEIESYQKFNPIDENCRFSV